MLRRHCDEMDECAEAIGVTIAPDALVFSLEADCGPAMPPDYLTRRVAALKDHLGVEEKRPENVALEDEALRLFRSRLRRGPRARQARRRRAGCRAERSVSGWREASDGLRWQSPRRPQEQAAPRTAERFDASIVALRKLASSELLDAGFNISMVAHRQGHGPQVLMKHYATSRRSADQRAARHLGAIVHGTRDVRR